MSWNRDQATADARRRGDIEAKGFLRRFFGRRFFNPHCTCQKGQGIMATTAIRKCKVHGDGS